MPEVHNFEDTDPVITAPDQPAPAAGGQEVHNFEDTVPVPRKPPTRTPSGVLDDLAGKAASGLKGAASGLMGVFGAASEALDSITGAPIRRGIETLQGGGTKSEALDNALGQFGADQTMYPVPDTKQLYENAGLSGKDEDGFNTHLLLNPFDDNNRSLKISPAGAAGAATGFLADPLTWAGLGEEKAADIAGTMGNRMAAKAATGSSLADVKRLGKIAKGGKGISVVEDANTGAKVAAGPMANIENVGHRIMQADEAGDPVLGQLSSAGDIAARAEAKRQFFGKKISEVGKVVDQYYPGAIDPEAILTEIADYYHSIPPTGEGRKLRKAILEDAQGWASMLEDPHTVINQNTGKRSTIMVPNGKQLTFSEAQLIKNQYRYAPLSQDAMMSNQDALNHVHNIIGRHMDEAVERIAASPNLPPDVQEFLKQYKSFKEPYGIYKDVAQSATNRALKEQSNRWFSPSSFLSALTSGGAAAAHGAGGMNALAVGTGAAVANQFALRYGNTLAARSADQVAHFLNGMPTLFKSWSPAIQSAMKLTPAGFSAWHHTMMNNDPDYAAKFRLVEGLNGQPPITPEAVQP